MAAETVSPDRVYQSRSQVVIVWCCVAVVVGGGVGALVQPTVAGTTAISIPTGAIGFLGDGAEVLGSTSSSGGASADGCG
jgi:hypothetical protein